MNDNLLISAVQAAFDEAVQKAVAVHLGPLRAKLDAVEAAASLVRTQAELVPSPDLDYDSLAARINLAALAVEISSEQLKEVASGLDMDALADEIDLADLASEIDADKLAGKFDLDSALKDWFENQSFSITP